jgi:predicted transcriptional regulator
MKELTKAEEQIMQVLWKLKQAFVHDIIEKLPEPKPAYNTVSTIVRILEKKGFVAYEAFGKTHRYYPLIDKKAYTNFIMKALMRNYFSNSFHQLVSYFSREKNLSLDELESLKNLIDEEIAKQNNNS